MPHRNRYESKVVIDVTPMSFQCYDADNCPVITALKNTMPSVKIEKGIDGTTTAMCPISQFAQAQETARVACFGCRIRG